MIYFLLNNFIICLQLYNFNYQIIHREMKGRWNKETDEKLDLLALKTIVLTSKIKVFILFYTYWTFIYFFTSDLNILFMLDSNLSYKIIYRWVICGSRWGDFNWSLIKRETEFKERFELVGVAGLGAMRDTWLTNFQEICFQERAVWRHAICNFVVQELGFV